MARTRSPRWLWRFAWLSLTAALTLTIGGALLLGLGAADPSRAGPLQWQITDQSTWQLAPGVDQNQVVGSNSNFIVPAPPFTLEVTARLSTASDLGTQWAVVLQPSPSAGNITPAVITIDGGGNYREGTSDQRLSFPHLHSVGEVNLLRLDVDASGIETIRFNDEFAWRGAYPPHLQPTRLKLLGFGGWQADSRLTWERIALYAPAQPGDSAASEPVAIFPQRR
ncbi:MAG: hypothetical protein ACYDBJ_23930 [Aggregatilineales bacterium]